MYRNQAAATVTAAGRKAPVSAGSAVLSRIRLLRPPFCCLYFASPARYIKYLAYFFAKKIPGRFFCREFYIKW